MTNKMPVVGKRYTLKKDGSEFIAIPQASKIRMCSTKYTSQDMLIESENLDILFEKLPEHEAEINIPLNVTVSRKDNPELFKELPENNLQETEEEPKLKIKCDKCGKNFKVLSFNNNPIGAFISAEPDCNCTKGYNSQETEEVQVKPSETKRNWTFKEIKDELVKAASKDIKNNEDFKKKEVNEVERALEELKERDKVLIGAQNVIKAVEAEKKNMSKHYYLGKAQDAPEDGYVQVGHGTELYQRLVNIHPTIVSKTKDAFFVKVTSKPEPKTDMKEERVEPVSIWKNMDQLLYKSSSIIIKSDQGNYAFGTGVETDSGKIIPCHFEAREIKVLKNSFNSIKPVHTLNAVSFCYLNDFINLFEQMQKDIEEFKRK